MLMNRMTPEGRITKLTLRVHWRKTVSNACPSRPDGVTLSTGTIVRAASWLVVVESVEIPSAVSTVECSVIRYVRICPTVCPAREGT